MALGVTQAKGVGPTHAFIHGRGGIPSCLDIQSPRVILDGEGPGFCSQGADDGVDARLGTYGAPDHRRRQAEDTGFDASHCGFVGRNPGDDVPCAVFQDIIQVGPKHIPMRLNRVAFVAEVVGE